ncbi:hypothetical protein BW723_16845 [Polaribacter reichenbachii]|uniref:YcxB-like protein domain-containing protein n=1 Tax=Polaribacter reichenbachii TaxID=996801 RepID=A0A1B8U5R8_9FLAO|nr:hypothetical protein [Polaribacter reichenbachii]APZ47858.1 hypothetical protein BW723_16845 [Polaribacter reichenbachii]AUC18492.1 hypothetical protein BTO17_07240 [Polaribacter reichenbachii]OBY67194.1 hypothetical protein LPB301_03410 [Polaribacter reichenbachii]
MKFKIPFDDKLFLEQTKLTIPFIYANQYKKIKELRLSVSILFGIGIIIQITGSDVSTLFFFLGILLFFVLYSKIENYKELKTNYIRSIKELLFYTPNTFGIFEFNEDRLLLSTDHLCSWYYWSDFSEFKIVKSSLLLFEKECSYNILVISKCELNTGEFERIINFVQKKIN